jgi:hypothetical protein
LCILSIPCGFYPSPFLVFEVVFLEKVAWTKSTTQPMTSEELAAADSPPNTECTSTKNKEEQGVCKALSSSAATNRMSLSIHDYQHLVLNGT